MKDPLDCAPAPCGSCPYACKTPAGIWAKEEYLKLIGYDEKSGNPPPLVVFLCHQTNAIGRETVCRGWLSVHPDCVAVRLAISRGQVTPEQRDAPPLVPLYRSGVEAAMAGLRGVRRPSRAAKRLMGRLLAKGAGR